MVHPMSMKLREFFEKTYRIKKLHGKSINSVRLYNVCISNFTKSLGYAPSLSDLNDDAVMRHMQFMLDNGRQKATANRDRCCLVALWRYAFQLKLVDNWPDVPKEREPTRIPVAWTREDIAKLLDAAWRLNGDMKDTTIPNRLWWKTLLMVLLDSGERVGAVRECRWDWLQGGQLLIPAEYRKGGKRDKWFLLSPETAELLNEIRRVSSDRINIFPWPYCSVYLWQRYKKLLEFADLPTGRKCGFHRCRKTHASVAFAAGLDPQELLDHADRRTTQRYLDPRFQRTTQASAILAEWLRNPPKKEDRKQA